MGKENGNKPQENETLVVGIGASAGGLEALQAFFNSLPDETGMVFLVVLHLAPEQKSNLAGILQRKTSLEVAQVAGRTEMKPEHVYVIPPGKMLTVEDNHLKLSEPDAKHAPDTIDLLFRTLAQKKKKHAAGIVLSGTGTDGSVGMKAIKEHGGIAIAQDPDEAQYPGMPQSAIKTGVVDKVLVVEDIAEELIKYKENLFQVRIPDTDDDKQQQQQQEVLSDIFEKIRTKTGHDFNNYRRSSVLRRIDRRMRVNRVTSLSEYADYLTEYPDEVDEVFKDLLISVTNFFRDPEAFEVLEKQVIPQLFEGKNRNDQVRVWVLGCATGEEAYSIAMLLQEYATEQSFSPDIQVFATDIDEEALDTARKGVYPDSIAGDISETRLRRFLKKEDNSYRVKKEIREMVLFASHDLLRTPPFSKQDLITCRNLLIYLNHDLQSEVFNLFHYALRPKGWLFLGTSDSRMGAKNLFTAVNKRYRIYRQKPAKHSHVSLPDMPLLYNKPHVTPRDSNRDTPARQSKKNIEKMHWSILARLYAPQSVLVTPDYEVIHSTDGIKKFLEYAGGEPSSNILDMVKSEIQKSLRNLLFQFRNDESMSGQKRVHISLDGQPKKLELIARRFSHAEFEEGLIHVVFKEIDDEAEERSAKEQAADEEISEDDADYIESLERELEYTKEQLQLSIEEYETSNEELRASNEELQSMNEELQTTTEELETSQEELRSMNEELTTLNEELENKVEELSRTHSDLENLMESTEVGIIFVNDDYRIQRFTSTSTEIFNLIESDEGRPLDHITHSLEYENMMDDVKHVLENLEKIKKVVRSSDGRWFIMRVRPYHSNENKIEGVVLTFTEFTELKEARDTIREKSYQESVAALGVYALEQDDLQLVLKRAIDIGCLNLELDCAVVYALDEDDGTFEISAQAGCAKKGDPLPVDKKWDAGFAFKNVNEPTIVTDYEEEKRFSISPYLKDEDIVSSVHLVARGADDTYGLLGFYSHEERVFTDTELHFLQTVANIVGMAIQQQHAKKELKKQTERSLQYQKEILNSSVVERWELGGYLHDNLGQMLASAKIILTDAKNRLMDGNTDVTSEIERVNEIIDEGIEGIRDLTHDIIPVDIEEEGVDHGFRFLMRQTQRMYDVNCTLETDKILDKIKDRKLATHLYHVVQEAVKNASVHGEAENIVISVKETDGHLTVRIKDDGIGLADAENGNNGKGIRIMKHRMELIGGSCGVEDISDADRTGTCVTCTIPLDKFSHKEE